ncbi:MAG: amino acid ABC transporter permease, partial [Alphaproteobacteria bacterium]|nr:amino acid ABC transporter permease [Alphaproteobacteria bacterium]
MVFLILIAGVVSGEQVVSYPILVLDLVLVTFGLLGARSIYSLWPHSKWLFLGWLLSFFLIGL